MEDMDYEAPRRRKIDWVSWPTVLVLAVLGIVFTLVHFDYIPVYRLSGETGVWVTPDHTTIHFWDAAHSGLRPNRKRVYDRLPREARGKLIMIQLSRSVEGASRGRLLQEIRADSTPIGWRMYITVGEGRLSSREKTRVNSAYIRLCVQIRGGDIEAEFDEAVANSRWPAIR